MSPDQIKEKPCEHCRLHFPLKILITTKNVGDIKVTFTHQPFGVNTRSSHRKNVSHIFSSMSGENACLPYLYSVP